jgi:hypothetical protein
MTRCAALPVAGRVLAAGRCAAKESIKIGLVQKNKGVGKEHNPNLFFTPKNRQLLEVPRGWIGLLRVKFKMS